MHICALVINWLPPQPTCCRYRQPAGTRPLPAIPGGGRWSRPDGSTGLPGERAAPHRHGRRAWKHCAPCARVRAAVPAGFPASLLTLLDFRSNLAVYSPVSCEMACRHIAAGSVARRPLERPMMSLALLPLERPRWRVVRDAGQVQGAGACGSSLFARYDPGQVATALARTGLARRPPVLCRYHKLLPSGYRQPGGRLHLPAGCGSPRCCPRAPRRRMAQRGRRGRGDQYRQRAEISAGSARGSCRAHPG